MKEEVSISMTVLNDLGKEFPLVTMNVPLDGRFTNLLNVINRLNAIKNANVVNFNIHPVLADGSPADINITQDGHQDVSWMVSFTPRAHAKQELLVFDSKDQAETFTRDLIDAFSKNRKFYLSTGYQTEPEPQKSAEIHQLIRKAPSAPSGFSPGG